jgi:hypothetical protein
MLCYFQKNKDNDEKHTNFVGVITLSWYILGHNVNIGNKAWLPGAWSGSERRGLEPIVHIGGPLRPQNSH